MPGKRCQEVGNEFLPIDPVHGGSKASKVPLIQDSADMAVRISQVLRSWPKTALFQRLEYCPPIGKHEREACVKKNGSNRHRLLSLERGS